MIRTVNALFAVMLAGVVTFSLFFLMQFLISGNDELPERTERTIIGDISIPELEIRPQRQEPKPDEPEELEEIPDLPEPQFDINAPTTQGISIARANIDVSGMNTNASISQADAEYLPIVTIQPQYPTRALQRGIEGWCQVMFTVNENGGVEDPVVVDAEPPNIFDSASIRAVQRFRFNPRTVDGQPVKTPGVQYVFTYQLAEED